MSKPEQKNAGSTAMHRIKQVRENEGVSLRAMAIRMKKTPSELRRQERADCDLRLSDLYHWQTALNVPLTELLDAPDYPQSEKLRHRANLIRVAKTARSLLSSNSPAVRRLAGTMVEQLVEVMPELQEQGPWPERSQTRNEPGRIAEHLIDSRWFPVDYEQP